MCASHVHACSFHTKADLLLDAPDITELKLGTSRKCYDCQAAIVHLHCPPKGVILSKGEMQTEYVERQEIWEHRAELRMAWWCWIVIPLSGFVGSRH